MRIIQIDELNRAVREDPAAYVEQAEYEYRKKLDRAATLIAERHETSPIVLVSGPSSAGKTTTSKRIEHRVEEMGIEVHTISLDDYFRTRTPENTPKDENGNDDLESPLCLDMTLLNRHLLKLAAGEKIYIPHFDFVTQSRGNSHRPLQLGKHEIAVIEGIHALNDEITGSIGDKATKVYLSTRTRVGVGEDVHVTPHLSRLIRRMIRDHNFRGTTPEQTIRAWDSIRRGEKLYITPYRHSAEIQFDTFIDYETSLLMPMVKKELKKLKGEILEHEDVKTLMRVADEFEPLKVKYVPDNSLLREFVGGGTFKY